MTHTLTCQEVVEKAGPKDAPSAGQPGLRLSKQCGDWSGRRLTSQQVGAFSLSGWYFQGADCSRASAATGEEGPPVFPRWGSHQPSRREPHAARAQPMPRLLSRGQRLPRWEGISACGEPAEVLGTKAEVDKLEQFGTSLFKESPLKKQSLYLKVDPLPKDSP